MRTPTSLDRIASHGRTTRPLSLIDLFAGCGGLSLGLELAGFRPIFVSELVPDAMETYLTNRPQYPELATDKAFDIFDITQRDGELDALVRRLRGKRKTLDIDLIAGGPPCQGYSGIGHRRTFKGIPKVEIPSNHLYRDMAQVIRAIRPKAFLFENVKGLLSSRWTAEGEKGEVWADVLDTFGAIPDYQIRYAVVQAKAYAVPQNRPRVLLVGIRRDLGWTPTLTGVADGLLPDPLGVPPDPVDLLGDLIDDDYVLGRATLSYPREMENETQRWFRRRASDGDESPKGSPLFDQEYSRHSARIVSKFRYMLENGGAIRTEDQTRKFAQRVIPGRWGPKGPTLTATALPDDYVHFSQPRILTVREWARLQTFPDWYRFAGKRTTGGRRRAGDPSAGEWHRELPKYTQIGNAVPVWLAAAVGKHLAGLLD